MADREFQDAVWAAANRYRDERPIDVGVLLDAAVDAGYPADWRTLARLAEIGPSSSGDFLRPFHVVEFFHQIARMRRPQSALDPFVVSPTILLAVADGGIDSGLGLVENAVVVDLIARSAHERIEWRTGQIFPLLEELQNSTFDLIVSSPPIRVRPEHISLSREERAVGRSNANLVLLRSARLLSEGGIAVFHLNEDLLWSNEGKHTQRLLADAGIYLSAVVSVAESMPVSSVPTMLAVFGRQQLDQLFVGRVSPGQELSELLHNLTHRTTGSRIELGGLVERDAFRGWNLYALEHELARQANGANLVRLGDIGVLRAVNVHSQYEGPSNSVYVPARGTGEVDAGRPNIEGRKARSFIEVELDPNRADADFVARWLSSPLGRRVREAVASGAIIPNLRLNALGQAPIMLPPLFAQGEISRVDRRLGSLSLELTERRAELWRQPLNARRIQESLDHMSRGQQAVWFEPLPFPLASILRAYETDDLIDRKVTRLLGFFEASAEFFAVILLSAISQNQQLFMEELRIAATAGPNGRWPFDRLTFGTWTNLGSSVAKAIRAHLASQDRNNIMETFAVRSPQLAEVLYSDALWHVLDGGREVRNQAAHGGFPSETELERRHERLARLLLDLRGVLSETFQEIELILPGGSEHRHGVFTFLHAKRLTGSHPVFHSRTLRTLTPLNHDGMYLVDTGDEEAGALPILPFVRLESGRSGTQQACYFLSRRENDGSFVFVSYHYEDEPELAIQDQDLQAAMTDLARFRRNARRVTASKAPGNDPSHSVRPYS
jgi:hypothetical protein